MATPDNTVFGSPGNDNLSGTSTGNDLIVGGAGNDNLAGLGGADTLDGGDGNDFLNGGAGNDLLLGGAGGDTLQPGPGNDTVDGGAILDRTNYTDGNTVSFVDAPSGVTLDLNGPVNTTGAQVGTATVGTEVDHIVNADFVQGSEFDDNLKGTSTFNLFEQFEGRGGNDTIDGGAIDSLGTGSNRVNYNSAPAGVNVDLGGGTASDGYGTTDTLININQVRGSSHDDTLTGSDTTAWTEAFEGRGGNDVIDGKGGLDQVRYDSATTGIVVDLGAGTATDGLGGTDTLLHIEGVRAGNFNDSLTGSDTSAAAGTAADFEFFAGMAGNDTIDGGGGFDRVDYTTAVFGVQVDLAAGTAQDGQGGTDTLRNIEGVRGGDFNDGLFGSDNATGVESFEGRAGNDFIDGRGGIDRIDYQGDYGAVSVDMRFGLANDGFGGTDSFVNIERVRGSGFNDSIIGDGGNDTIEGNGGDDTLAGAGGNDTFVYLASGRSPGVDLITDFNAGDVIDVRSALTPGAVAAGNGSSVAPHGVEATTNGGVTTLSIDVDGVTGADLHIQLAGTYDPAGFTIQAGAVPGQSFITYSATAAFTPTRVSGFPSLGNAGDTIGGTTGDDLLTGGRADDNITGNDGNDTLLGGTGNDTLNGGNGDDLLQGGAGSDTLFGGAGNDTLDGGAITDRVNYTDLNFASFSGVTGGGMTIDLAHGTTTIGTEHDTLVDINFVQGSNQDDTILGSSTFNLFEQFEGLAGNDTIDGGAIDALQTNGNRVNYQNAPAAVDVTLGGAADGIALDGYGTTDTLRNINFVRGSNFNDTLTGSDTTAFTEFFDGRGGNDLIDGHGGFDVARYDGATAQVNVNLALGTASDGQGGNDTLVGIEGVRGGSAGDILTGGNPNSDALEVFQGNGGNDTIDGGSGFDRADYNTATFGVNVDLAQGTAVDGQGGFDTLINIEGVRGSEFSDVLLGSDNPGLESFEGRAGDDFIDGRGGIDRVDYQNDWNGVVVNLQTGVATDGQGGTDHLFNIENVRGSSFDDVITGSNVENQLQGGNGNDVLQDLAGNDTLDGGAGTDTVNYAAAQGGVFVDLQSGFANGPAIGNDTLVSIENVVGTGFNDNISGSDAANVLQGGGGDDYFTPGAGDDLVDGGQGSDTVSYEDATAGVTVDLKAGQASGASTGTDTLVSIEGAHGSRFDDTLIAADSGSFMMGRAGNDSMVGGAGNDNFVGGSGNDTIVGTAGGFDGVAYFDDGFDGFGAGTQGVSVNLATGVATDNFGGTDTLVNIQAVTGSSLNDTIVGNAGNNFFDGAEGDDTIDGGAGSDTIGFNNATTGVHVDLVAGTATGLGNDTLLNIEGVSGTRFDDVVHLGNSGGNVFGGDGNDTLVGGDGSDFFNGGLGDDSIDGGAGRDTASYEGSGSSVNVNLLTGSATGAATGNDTLVGIENANGGSFNDSIVLGNVAGSAIGRGGNDTLVGGSGDDFFQGGSGADSITGGAGFDTIDYNADFDNAGVPLTGHGVTVNLATGTATDNWGATDTFSGIELVRGSNLADVLTGGNPLNGSGATDGFEGFTGQGGDDTIDGGAGFDRAQYDTSTSAVNVTLGGTGVGTAEDGLGGTDTLISIEEVRGSNFNDTLTGSDSGVFESFEGRGGNDIIDGKGGIDRVNYQTSGSGVNVDLVHGFASDGFGGSDVLRNIENIRGSEFDDVLTGDAGNNDLEARGGNDLLQGGAGQDTLRGGAGDDTLDGGSQVVLTGWAATANTSGEVDIASYADAPGAVTIRLGVDGTAGTATGAAGNDVLKDIELVIGSGFGDEIHGSNRAVNELIRGGAGDDTLFGGAETGTDAGTNFVDYRSANGAVTVSLATGTASGADGNDQLSGFQGIFGGNFNDTLTGDAQDNFLQGGTGNDALDGGAGLRDLASYQNAAGSVTVNLATGTASGADGNDTLVNIEDVRGSESADTLTGNDGDNRIQGRAGNDVIDGGAGNDELHGGFGNDTLTGGAGRDTFQFGAAGEGTDTITDFAAGDQLTVSASLATSGVTDGDGSTVSGFGIQSQVVNGVTTLSIDTDGNAGADVQIQLQGAFQSADFDVVHNADGSSSISVNGPVQGAPVVQGSVAEDQVLTVSTAGLSDVDGLGAFSYQWFRDGAAVSGATGSSYQLGDADVGHAMSVGVSYVDGKGNAEAARSTATGPVASVNDAPTGAVTISGTPTENQVLTVSNTLADADGLGAISYQWLANGTPVATGNTLTLTQAFVGKTMTAVASYTDLQGHAESVSSAATAPVANVNQAPTGSVAIAGAFTQGQTLTVTQSLADADGLGAISYQWLANGSAIANATGTTFALGEAQVGKTITVQASYTDGGGTHESVTSAGQVVANVNDPLVGGVVIDQTAPKQGDVLTATNSFSDLDGVGTVHYQWFANGSIINGATSATFAPGQAQVGKTLTVTGSYVDGHGTSESRVSAATAAVVNVNDAATGAPVVANTAPAQGQTLTVDTHAIADADGLGAFSYQWLAGGAAIAGATASTLTLDQGEVGKAISVNVSFTDAFGTKESLTSVPGAPVANVNDSPTGAVSIDGAKVVGMPLHAGTDTIADLDGLGTFNFQWLRDGAAIAGATSATYTPVAADGSNDISVQVHYTDAFGHAESLTSVAVAVVNEDLVPVLVADGVTAVAGDGNGDGIKDSQQDAVVSAPLTVQDSTGAAQPVFVTLVADASASGGVNDNSTAAIKNLNQEAAPEVRPATLAAPLGLIDFQAATTAGKTESFTLFVDAKLGVNGYWKQDDAGTWVNLASKPFGGATTLVGNKIRLDFQITDGGTFDNDHHVDGVITDPAIIGAMPLSVVGYTPDVTLTPTTHFFF